MWGLLIFIAAFLNGHYSSEAAEVSVVVLGTIQDAGSPHIACRRECCISLHNTPDANRLIVSLGVIDDAADKTYLFEATPDITRQLEVLQSVSGKQSAVPDGIFLTHAHIGHYTGLMFLGREALGAKAASVYAMPRMQSFIENNGPWNQLVTLNNIQLVGLAEDRPVQLSENLTVTPIRVPHRDEYSETVGFRIEGPTKSLLFIPDIDKWSKWDKNVVDEIANVDFALIDGSFFSAEELGYRDMGEIPHPSVRESMDELHELSRRERSKVYFIHLNHTNPLLDRGSDAFLETTANGFKVASFLDQFVL